MKKFLIIIFLLFLVLIISGCPQPGQSIFSDSKNSENKIDVAAFVGQAVRHQIQGGFEVTSRAPTDKGGFVTVKAVCSRRDDCVTRARNCVPYLTTLNVGTAEKPTPFTCSTKNNFIAGVVVQSELSGLTYQAVCPDYARCVDNNHNCVRHGSQIIFGQILGCYIQPGNPPVNSWHSLRFDTQSYVPGENRARPPIRRGRCLQENQCIARNGVCYDTGEINKAEIEFDLVCRDSNWVGCSQYSSVEPQSSPLEWFDQMVDNMLPDFSPPPNSMYSTSLGLKPTVLGDYDSIISSRASAVCINGNFVNVECDYQHLIATDVFIDTTYIDVSDELVRETFAQASTFLCSQTPNMNYGYQVRDISRYALSDLERGDGEFITNWYQQRDRSFPELLVRFTHINGLAGMGGEIRDESGNYCNRYRLPTLNINYPHDSSSFSVVDIDVTSLQGAPIDRITSEFLNFNSIINHEFLHQYGSGHWYWGNEYYQGCYNILTDPTYQGREADIMGICGDAIFHLINGTQVCEH